MNIKNMALVLSFITANALGISYFVSTFHENKSLNTRDISSEKPVSFGKINTYQAFNQKENTKETLFTAIKFGDLATVKNLIENKGETLSLNDKGQNALIFAVIHKQEAVFNYLLTKGYNLDHQDIYGMTALMYAVESDETKMLKAMLKKEHDLTILSAGEKSVYDIAKEKHAKNSIKILEKMEAPCNKSCEI